MSNSFILYLKMADIDHGRVGNSEYPLVIEVICD